MGSELSAGLCFLISSLAVLFSPALNYVWPYYHRHKSTLPPSVAARLEAGDPHVHTHQYGDALLKEDFAADSRKYEIDLEAALDITCPVRIIHGLENTEIDPKHSLQVGRNTLISNNCHLHYIIVSTQLCTSLVSDDVDLIYRKNSEHMLESPPDLELFLITLDRYTLLVMLLVMSVIRLYFQDDQRQPCALKNIQNIAPSI